MSELVNSSRFSSGLKTGPTEIGNELASQWLERWTRD